MKLYFDNIFGHQTDGDLLFSVVNAEFIKMNGIMPLKMVGLR